MDASIDLEALTLDELLALNERLMARLNELQMVELSDGSARLRTGDRAVAAPRGQFNLAGEIEQIDYRTAVLVTVAGAGQTVKVPPRPSFLRAIRPEPDGGSRVVLLRPRGE